MVYSNTATLPVPEEALEHEDILVLIEAHRKLVSSFGIDAGREEDTYSLAQPSPYRFVPTIAASQTTLGTAGE